MHPKDVTVGMEIALKAAHALRERIGRIPHPAEIRWAVCAAFRRRYPIMARSTADKYADRMIDNVRREA